MDQIVRIFKKQFSLDLRSLALMRILLGLVLITDLSIRISDLVAFYTDGGILPRSLLQYAEYEFTNPYFFSLLNISGHWFPILLIYIAAFISAFNMTIGYRTKWFTVLSWIFLVSIQNRNPFIVQGGDGYLRLILFWAMFLPWGARFSVDATKREPSGEKRHFSLAGVAYILQVISLYFFTGLLKNGEEWRSNFTALYYALSLDQLVKPIGKFLLPYGELLQALTATTLFVEFLIPLLLILPFKREWLRGFALIFVLGLHLSIELMMQVGLFSFISIAAASALTPSGFMDWLAKRAHKIKGKINRFYHRYAIWIQKIPSIHIRHQFKNSWLQPLKTTFIALCLAIGVYWNISTLYEVPPTVSKVVDPVGAFIRLDQHWGMFAPAVFKEDGWFIKEAHQGDTVFDIYTYPDSISYAKPKLAVRQFKSARWRKFGENIIFISNIPVRNSYCEFELERWNKNHPTQQLDSLVLIYMMETTLPNYQVPEVSREELCTCYSD